MPSFFDKMESQGQQEAPVKQAGLSFFDKMESSLPTKRANLELIQKPEQVDGAAINPYEADPPEEINPYIETAKNTASVIPYAAASAVKGVMSPILPALKAVGLDTGEVLDTAINYWRDKTGKSLNVPNYGIGTDKSGSIELQKLVDMPVTDMIGGTAEAGGFIAGPVNAASKASGAVVNVISDGVTASPLVASGLTGKLINPTLNVINKTSSAVAGKLANSARPFFQSIAKGMVTGGLLGEGDTEKTLENAALFGVFEPIAYALGKTLQAPKIIKNSNTWRKMTVSERGLVIQSLDDMIAKNPQMTEAQILKQWKNPQWRNEALAKRMKPENGRTEPPMAETPTPKPGDPPTEPSGGGAVAKVQGNVQPVEPPAPPAVAPKSFFETMESDQKRLADESGFDIESEPERQIDELPDREIQSILQQDRAKRSGRTVEGIQEEQRLAKEASISKVESPNAPVEKQPKSVLKSLPPQETPEQHIERLQKQIADRDQKAVSIAKEHGNKPVVLVNDAGDRGVLIHPSSKKPGKFQATWWDKRGFSGDTNFDSVEAAVKNGMQDGYVNVNPEAFKQISKSGKFRKSPAAFAKAKEYIEGGAPSGPVIELGGSEKPMKLYHGTDREFDIKDIETPAYFSPDKSAAKKYTSEKETKFSKPRIIEVDASPEKIASEKDILNVSNNVDKDFSGKPIYEILWDKDVVNGLKKQGYDAVRFTDDYNGKFETVGILDKTKITSNTPSPKDILIKTVGKKETVSVDIPKSLADKLKPKQQKDYLLQEIDVALDSAKKHGGPRVENVKIKVPGDGEFEVWNSEDALNELKKKVKKSFPGTAPKPITTKNFKGKNSTGRVIKGDGLEFYNHFEPKVKRPVVAPAMQPKTLANPNPERKIPVYELGYYSNYAYGIKIPKPANMKFKDGFKDTFKDLVEDAKRSKTPLKLVGEFQGGNETSSSDVVIHGIDEHGNSIYLNSDYIDNILTHHPKAEAFTNGQEETMVSFKVGKDIVGFVMPTRIGEEVFTDYHKNRFEKITGNKFKDKKKNPISNQRGSIPLKGLGLADAVKKHRAEKTKKAGKIEKDREFANRIHEERDVKKHYVELKVQEIQEGIQRLAGESSQKSKIVPHLLTSQKNIKQSMASKELDKAMMFYRDFVQKQPEKADELRAYLEKEAKTRFGAKKLRAKDYLRILDIAENLTEEQKSFVATKLHDAFEEVEAMAKKEGIISTTHENYVRRIWDFDKKSSGKSTGALKTFTTAKMRRTLPTIADGIIKGYDLKVEGISNSYGSIAAELSIIKSNKDFLKYGMKQGVFTTEKKDGFSALDAEGFKAWMWKGQVQATVPEGEESVLTIDNYNRKIFFSPPEVKDKNGEVIEKSDMFAQVPLYAPESIAKMINLMTQTPSGFWEAPGAKQLLRLNNSLKGYILMSSFFHHLAGTRSWILGVETGKHINPVEAHKRGLAKIKERAPIIEIGIKNGLTLGNMADFDEEALRHSRGLIETMVRAAGLEKPARVIELAKAKRENFTNSLFKRLFAGLKAEAFSVHYTHELQKAYKTGEPVNPDKIAEAVARLINADFGGLHLKRMGRSPDIQNMLRVLLLAPDWTESNFRAATGTIPGLNKAIGKVMDEMPAPPGMGSLYRRFWARVLIKGALSTIIANLAINGYDDTKKFYKREFKGDQWKRFRWADVDVTKVYKVLGVKPSHGEKKTFPIVGHFKDPLKLINPPKLIKGKGSPAVKIATNIMGGSDYADRPFTSLSELLRTGKTIKKSRFNKTEEFGPRIPSTMVNTFISLQPIQIGNLLKYYQGEEDGLSAIMSSMGAHVGTSYVKQLKH